NLCFLFQSSPLQTFPQIEAIILFGEPIRWETNLQLLIDVLLTNGSPAGMHALAASQLPVLACNIDLTWMAEAPSPRDNLMTDIYGANLYDRYLSQQHAAMTTTTKLVAQGTGSQVTMTVSCMNSVSTCTPSLCPQVCTGVYNPSDGNTAVSESVFHGHRDLVLDLELVEPHHVVEDVEEAVDLLLQRENLTSDL
uniref:Uncharacterized protein n=1 Tax=Sander lucioperca TaxID=283035 RepID=A0A8D0DAU6_SANLU